MNISDYVSWAPRVRPRIWIGVVAYLAYLAVFYGIWIINGIDYARVGESEDTLLKWYVQPLAGGLVVITVLVTVFGWWRPSMTEARRLPRWAWAVPAALAAVAIVNMIFGDFTTVTPTMWVYLVIGSLLVGFNEELVTRGQLMVALRSRFGETGVWLLSTVLFALLHLPNAFFGIGALAIVQVFITFGMGSVFYLARRVSGSLIPAMVLHGLWDFSTFSAHVPYAGLMAPLLGIAGVIVVVVLLRREKREKFAGLDLSGRRVAAP
jgi:membrane protease YdiL (CAAX protease family)